MFALTPGEPAGIGPDLLIQAVQTRRIPGVVFGDPQLLQDRAAQLQCPLTIQCVSAPYPRTPAPLQHLYVAPIPLGTPAYPGVLQAAHNAAVYASLDAAIDACLTGACVGLITGPVHKAQLHSPTTPFHGQTEYLAQRTQTPAVLMMFAAPGYPALALVTRHIPLHQVATAITPAALHTTCDLLIRGLEQLRGLTHPTIGVLGLNPHAGEHGTLGTEEDTIITPTLAACRAAHPSAMIEGPLSPDSAFLGPALARYDGLVALYHDQGLAPFKALTQGLAVHLTIGLPFLRLSVDHGTALSLAGTGQARVDSFQAVLAFAEEVFPWENV